MQINNISNLNIKGLSINKLINPNRMKQYKYMQEACYKMGGMAGLSSSELIDLTKNADVNQFDFLRTMVNKFHKQNFRTMEDDSQHILNIYSIVNKPSALHFDIVKRTKDSFGSLEKIFSLAQDEKSLEFVQNLQYDILKNKQNQSKIIIDLLSSNYRELYINKPERYSSYLKLHADEKDVVKNLDSLLDSGKYSRFKSDAQLAIRKLMKQKRIETAMAGKTSTLEKLYTEERANFLSNIIKSFIPVKTEPKENTKVIVVDMYGTLNKKNAGLRQSIISRFKTNKLQDKTNELKEMQILFNKIDTNPEVEKFVKKAINKDLKVDSIAELNEVIDNVPLKKANVFFNNAKRIIELSSGEERKTALVKELENPFFTPRVKKQNLTRMFMSNQTSDNIFTKFTKIIENKYNQFIYSRMAA